MFGKLADRVNVEGRFYSLRRTFQTVAEESGDYPAVSHVMGHAIPSMAAVYQNERKEREFENRKKRTQKGANR